MFLCSSRSIRFFNNWKKRQEIAIRGKEAKVNAFLKNLLPKKFHSVAMDQAITSLVQNGTVEVNISHKECSKWGVMYGPHAEDGLLRLEEFFGKTVKASWKKQVIVQVGMAICCPDFHNTTLNVVLKAK